MALSYDDIVLFNFPIKEILLSDKRHHYDQLKKEERMNFKKKIPLAITSL